MSAAYEHFLTEAGNVGAPVDRSMHANLNVVPFFAADSLCEAKVDVVNTEPWVSTEADDSKVRSHGPPMLVTLARTLTDVRAPCVISLIHPLSCRRSRPSPFSSFKSRLARARTLSAAGTRILMCCTAT